MEETVGIYGVDLVLVGMGFPQCGTTMIGVTDNQARIYYFDDGRRDTIKGDKPIISTGFHHTTNKLIGGFFTIGNKGYFVIDFNSTYERDRSTYFPYGSINLVDFPLISELIKQKSFYIGVGEKNKKIRSSRYDWNKQ